MLSEELKANTKAKNISSKENVEYDLAQIKARLENDPAYMKRIRERTDHYFTDVVVATENLKQA